MLYGSAFSNGPQPMEQPTAESGNCAANSVSKAESEKRSIGHKLAVPRRLLRASRNTETKLTSDRLISFHLN